MALFEEHLPKWLKLYEEKFVPKDGFFLGDEVSLEPFSLSGLTTVFLGLCSLVSKKDVKWQGLPPGGLLFHRSFCTLF